MESSLRELAGYRMERERKCFQQRRETSDYDDFFVVGKTETENQLVNAKIFLETVEKYLENGITETAIKRWM